MTDAQPSEDLETTEAAIQRATALVISHFDRIDRKIDAAMAETRARLTQLEQRQDELAASQATLRGEVRYATGVMSVLIEDVRRPGASPPIPAPGGHAPRPAELDAACAADPADGVQRIVVDVRGRTVTSRVEPGTDPASLWADLCVAVETGGGQRAASADDSVQQPSR